MVWGAFSYVLGMTVSLYVLLSSRHLVTYKRWYDFAFWQGLTFFAWGLGHLLAMSDLTWYRWLGHVLDGVSSLLLLMALQSYPLPPHLFYPRWKTGLDAWIVTALYASWALAVLSPGDVCQDMGILLHLLLNGYLGVSVLAVTAAHRHGHQDQPSWSLIGLAGFLLLDALAELLPGGLWLAGMCASFVLIVAGQRVQRELPSLDVRHEYAYFLENMEFQQRDEKWVGRFMLLFAVCLLIEHHVTPEVLAGAGVTAALLAARWIAAGYENQQVMKQLFQMSGHLERHFEEYARAIRVKNEEMTGLLSLKQSYERLLTKSNEQNMQDVDYENIHQMIEEIVTEWYETIPQMACLRLSLQAADGSVYYEVKRGRCPVASQRWFDLCVRLVVDEERDTPLSPRYVVVEAEPFATDGTEEASSFLHLLAVHVRGLLQRCLQNHQALELRLVAQEMELASKIQFSLIPRERLTLPGLEAKAVYIPAAYVGGDYVDYVVLDERYSCFLVADISGHGIPASMLTTGLRSAFRAVIQTCVSPDEILERLNSLLYDDMSRTRSFITMFIAVYDHQDRVLLTSRAGHPQPLCLSASRQILFPSRGGAGLGLMGNAVYPLDRWNVDEDTYLMIYTDGLTQLGRTEGETGALRWLDAFRVAVRVAQETGDDPIEAIEQSIWEKKREMQQEDDISVLILYLKARS